MSDVVEKRNWAVGHWQISVGRNEGRAGSRVNRSEDNKGLWEKGRDSGSSMSSYIYAIRRCS